MQGITSTMFMIIHSYHAKRTTKKTLKKFRIKDALSDPAIELLSAVWGDVIGKDMPILNELDLQIDSLYRHYVVGIMDMNSGKDFYPDANLSLRVAYGNIKPYKPRDGVNYFTHTTIKGIMEKENPDIYDYVVEKET